MSRILRYPSIFLQSKSKFKQFCKNLNIFFFQIFDDHYHFIHRRLAKRSLEPSNHHQNKLENDDRVRWSKQQRAKSRQKRDLLRTKSIKTLNNILNDPKWPAMWYLVSKVIFSKFLSNHKKLTYWELTFGTV